MGGGQGHGFQRSCSEANGASPGLVARVSAPGCPGCPCLSSLSLDPLPSAATRDVGPREEAGGEMRSGCVGEAFHPAPVRVSLKFSPKLVIFPQENALFCIIFCVNGITLKYSSLHKDLPTPPTWLGFLQMHPSPLWTDDCGVPLCTGLCVFLPISAPGSIFRGKVVGSCVVFLSTANRPGPWGLFYFEHSECLFSTLQQAADLFGSQVIYL